VERLIDVRWKRKLLTGPQWRVDDRGTSHYITLSRLPLWLMPRSLRAPGVESRFEALVKGPIENWWGQTTPEDEDAAFCLRFEKGRWDIPWELLIGRLVYAPQKRASACLVRGLDMDLPIAPRVFDEPMRVLLLQGDDGEFIGQKLDLAKEIAGIRNAWDGLEKSVQACVLQPAVETVTRRNLAELVFGHKPHLLWFSGHGHSKPRTRVLLADRSWVEAAEFARLVSEKGHVPLYAVFWACDTANDAGTERGMHGAPELFRELRKAGVLSLLAMQAPIRDASARAMAADLFRFLALGLPLERAATRTRANQMETSLEGAHKLDWACPVVWSAGELTGQRLQWNAAGSELLNLQIFGTLVIRVGLALDGELENPPSTDELLRAQLWTENARVWVPGSAGGEHLYKWARVLRAIQTGTTSWVLAINIESTDTFGALQKWAETVHSRLRLADVSEEIAGVVSEIRRTPTSGWDKLCRRTDVTLALCGSLPLASADFWRPLRSPEGSARVVLLSEKAIFEDTDEKWLTESVDTEMSEAALNSALEAAPDLARALAVLNIPIRSSWIRISSADAEGARSLNEWPAAKAILIETPSGPLITATARRQILANLEGAKRQKAHRHCAEILGEPALTKTARLREHRLTHLLNWGEDPALAIEEASNLCKAYRSEDRPMALLGVIKRLGPLRTQVSSSVRLVIAWAYLRLNRVEDAEFWLARATALSIVELAEKHGLSAEIQKIIGRPGSKESALSEINQAIELCTEAAKNAELRPTALRMKRAYRQDHARILQYLFYERERAANEYKQLLEEWGGDPGAEIDVAVVSRNLAECLRSMRRSSENVARVRDLLDEAIKNIRANHPDALILAELLYERSKTAASEGDDVAASQFLDECREAAKKTHNHMVLALAENRAFWRQPNFDEKHWREIEAQLTGFSPHGWAIRACIDGRLRAAHHFENQGEFERAYSVLGQNLEDFQRNPSFNVGGDRLRIAATFAGLDINEAKLGLAAKHWQLFLARNSWAKEWLMARTGQSPQAVWAEV
jgi:hypothetical protein